MWRPRSLAQRVVLSVALGAISAGAIVALVTALLANHLASEQEDSHLLAAAGTLAFELEVKHYDPLSAVAEETHELAHTGIVVALFQHGKYLSGDSQLPYVAPGSCTSSRELRVCAVTADRWVSVAGRDNTRMRVQADATLTAAGIALLVTSLLSIGLALLLASAAIKPLHALTERVRQLPVHTREAADLGPASDVREVEALRTSLLETFAALRRALARSHSFSGDAAHQLRTPLATISAELDLALEAIEALEAKDSSALGQCLRARQQATRLAALIDQLLILASPEDTLQVATAVSLTQLAEDAVRGLPDVARERVAVSGASVTLQADPNLLSTAFAAALDRSLERSAGAIRVSTHAHARHALFVIEYEELPRGPLEVIGDRAEDVARSQGPTTTHRGEPADDIGRAVVERVMAVHAGHARFVDGRGRARVELMLPLIARPG